MNLTGKENIDPQQFFHLSDNSRGLRGHSLKLSFNKSRLDLRKNLFSQRVISSWNSLLQHVVDATSVNTFKNPLDAHWKAIMAFQGASRGSIGYGHNNTSNK